MYMLKKIYQKLKYRIHNTIRFKKDIKLYNTLNCNNKFRIKHDDMSMIYEDETFASSTLDYHYFLQDLYFAKIINKVSPENHYDIGSRIDGFISHLLSAGTKVTLFDIRPFPVQLDNLNFIQADATNLDTIEDESIESISSLHAIEHFGLGRYGDDIDPCAWEKCLKSIQRKLKSEGLLYLGLPSGNRDKMCFNAHRIFSPLTIINVLDEMNLESFSYVHGSNIISVDINNIENALSQMGDYECGLYIFKKRKKKNNT